MDSKAPSRPEMGKPATAESDGRTTKQSARATQLDQSQSSARWLTSSRQICWAADDERADNQARP
jgi:hypothetical protein